MIRHFSRDDRKMKRTFHKSIQIETGDDNIISDFFQITLIRDSLKLEKRIGISVDEANVKIDQHNQ